MKVMNTCRTRWLSVLLVCWICDAQAAPQNKPLDVCQVLQNLGRYRGQMITIRGEFVGNAIAGPGCPVLKTGDHEWHNGILIDIPHESYAVIDPPAGWKIDLKNWDRALERWKTLRKRGNDTPVFATVIGRLDTRNEQLGVPERIPALPDTKIIPWGYGHLGFFPARLVLFEIKDVELSTNRGR